ncbi:hypothetical protein YC2023_105556 [Brassica napus]
MLSYKNTSTLTLKEFWLPGSGPDFGVPPFSGIIAIKKLLNSKPKLILNYTSKAKAITSHLVLFSVFICSGFEEISDEKIYEDACVYEQGFHDIYHSTAEDMSQAMNK